MSWFHKDSGGKVRPILKHADYTAILGAESADGRLTRLCYTGHAGVSETGIVQGIEIPPGGGDPKTLWRAELAHERDLESDRVAVADGCVVTLQWDGKQNSVIGHDLWTGKEKWRVSVPRMVSNLRLDGAHTVVFVTIDHAVHAIDVKTGNDQLRDPVPTDQARDRVMNKLRKPRQDFSTEGTSNAPEEWSDMRKVSKGLAVFERDWAGTREMGIATGDSMAHPHLVGRGSYGGSMLVENVRVLSFRLDIDGTHHTHWYLYANDHPTLLAVLREDGQSELFANGASCWKGKL